MRGNKSEQSDSPREYISVEPKRKQNAGSANAFVFWRYNPWLFSEQSVCVCGYLLSQTVMKTNRKRHVADKTERDKIKLNGDSHCFATIDLVSSELTVGTWNRHVNRVG